MISYQLAAFWFLIGAGYWTLASAQPLAAFILFAIGMGVGIHYLTRSVR